MKTLVCNFYPLRSVVALPGEAIMEWKAKANGERLGASDLWVGGLIGAENFTLKLADGAG
jgi:hypothetical protein